MVYPEGYIIEYFNIFILHSYRATDEKTILKGSTERFIVFPRQF